MDWLVDKNEEVASVGGVVDESSATLAIYSPKLDPEFLTTALNCNPTTSFKSGSRRRTSSPPRRLGAWLLTCEGRAPKGPDDLVNACLNEISPNATTWQTILETHTVRLIIAAHFGGWNKGFALEPGTLRRISALQIEASFDLYYAGDNELDGFFARGV